MNESRKTYHGVVTTNCLRASKLKGTPSVTVQVHATTDISTGEAVDIVITGELWLTDKTIDNTLETLAHVFGWEGTSLRELNSPVLAGIEVDIVTHTETYEGKAFTKVDFFNRPGETGFGLQKAQDGEADIIATKYDAALRQFRAGKTGQSMRPDRAKSPAPAVPKMPSPPPRPAYTEDDLPF